MAWKTKDVDDAFSESRWIFIMILVQLEVLLFALPLIPLLHDVATDARYIGYALLIWTFPTTALCLILGPHVYAYYQGHESLPMPPRIRGEYPGGKVRVSGLFSNRTVDVGNPAQQHPGQRGLVLTSEGTQTDPMDCLYRSSSSERAIIIIPPDEGGGGGGYNNSNNSGVTRRGKQSNDNAKDEQHPQQE
jgi:hypothetical protein